MSYTKMNLTETADSAPKFGFEEMRRPRKPQLFAHRHHNAEEVYVVLGGSGRMRLDDEIIDVQALDAIRVEPQVTRAFEAGPDGIQWLAFGAHFDKDGEVLRDFWKD
jgi:mannose-6-phosphate isomerase-like protein (cupin superfamily)